jgi:hypothetical protein
MISESEIAWLQDSHPLLVVNSERTEVTGELVFAAAYDKSIDSFTPLVKPGQAAPGLLLRGAYDILIKKGKNEKILPTLRIHGNKVTRILDRHFYGDGHACLCGPIEEVDHMNAGLSFPEYLMQLVYPFLYGQVYYDLHNKWPWNDYSHGSAGIFESYHRSGSTREHAETSIRKLRASKHEWVRIHKFLSGGERIGGATNCACGPRHKMKEHPSVWFGLYKLRQAISAHRLSLETTEEQQSDSVK